MSLELRQSTSRVIRVGPFVDRLDGVTRETGLTLGAADHAALMKAGGGAAVDISGRTWAAVSGADGYYDLTLTASDTDTVGDITIDVADASVTLGTNEPLRATVIEESVYDLLYASGADLAASVGQTTARLLRPTKNATYSDIPFKMIDSSDNVSGKTGLTITAKRSIDGGAFLNGTGTVSEISDGNYQYDASAADMNGNKIILRFTATGALPTEITLFTTP